MLSRKLDLNMESRSEAQFGDVTVGIFSIWIAFKDMRPNEITRELNIDG